MKTYPCFIHLFVTEIIEFRNQENKHWYTAIEAASR